MYVITPTILGKVIVHTLYVCNANGYTFPVYVTKVVVTYRMKTHLTFLFKYKHIPQRIRYDCVMRNRVYTWLLFPHNINVRIHR